MTGVAKDGIPRRVVLRAPLLAVSAKTLAEMIEFSGHGPVEHLIKQPGFPAARYPTGSSTPRWIVSEVRTWLEKDASRVSAGRKKYRPRKSRAAAMSTAASATTSANNNTEPVEVIQ